MKKMNLIIVCVCLSLVASPAIALQSSNTIAVSVLVQGAFGLRVNSDSFDFANLLPGQTGNMSRSDGIVVAGTSSSGNPWYLVVAAAKPLSSGSDFIPSDNFTWRSSSEGKGEWYGSRDRSLEQQNTAYISNVDESSSAAVVANRFKFRLHVPEDTKPGSYTTTVMFTMTE